MSCAICDRVGGPWVSCTVCDRYKVPIGRSAPLVTAGHLCDSDCPGYREEPHPGELWPGERYGDSLGHMAWHDEVTAALAPPAREGVG